ncbi:MAG: hypothetical protein ACRED1_14990, partial [Limisphaerales bacterium]
MSESATTASNPPAQQSQPGPAPQPNARSKAASPLVIGLGAVVVAALLYFGLNYFAATLTSESTDDAFIAGHIVSIAPRISGQVSAVYVVD